MNNSNGLGSRTFNVGVDPGYLPQFGGIIRYVSISGNNDNDGLSPSEAKLTIGAAIALSTSGDAISVKAGTYTETGLDLGTGGTIHSLELWPEIGTIIDPATGTALIVSGNYCKIWCPGGSMKITPAAGQTGLLVTGNFCYISDVRIACGSSANLGFDIGASGTTDGSGSVLDNCRCSDPLLAAFKIQGDTVKIENCCTGGTVVNNSIGFWVLNNADKLRLRSCSSQGHANSGYYLDTGCTNGLIYQCASGGGDGRWRDLDHSAVWSNFTYDDTIVKDITLDGSTTYNIFKLTGSVRVSDIYAMVKTIIANTASNAHLELYSTGGTADITDAPGSNIQALPVGSVIERIEASSGALGIANAATPAILEAATFRDPKNSIDCIADADQTTYIRLVLSVAVASGEFHFHCTWEPLSDTGFLEGV